jgi:hypothetical protein
MVTKTNARSATIALSVVGVPAPTDLVRTVEAVRLALASQQ